MQRCEEQWARLGWGFWLDGGNWESANFADDILLSIATKMDLDSMIRDAAGGVIKCGSGSGSKHKNGQRILRNLKKHGEWTKNRFL